MVLAAELLSMAIEACPCCSDAVFELGRIGVVKCDDLSQVCDSADMW